LVCARKLGQQLKNCLPLPCTVFATDTFDIHDGMHWNKKQYVAKTCSFHMVYIWICVSQSNPFKNWKTNNKTADLLFSESETLDSTSGTSMRWIVFATEAWLQTKLFYLVVHFFNYTNVKFQVIWCSSKKATRKKDRPSWSEYKADTILEFLFCNAWVHHSSYPFPIPPCNKINISTSNYIHLFLVCFLFHWVWCIFSVTVLKSIAKCHFFQIQRNRGKYDSLKIFFFYHLQWREGHIIKSGCRITSILHYKPLIILSFYIFLQHFEKISG